MATVFEQIDDRLRAWLLAQPVFFVGTAPLSGDGHVNISPKGMAGTFAVLDPHRVAYLDYFGSGIETVAHLRENRRIVIMCCAFSGPPKIVRLHGTGRAIPRDDAEFAALRRHFAKDRDHGLRSIIVVDVERIADSCGYGVPLMGYEGERPHAEAWAEKKVRVGGAEALRDYEAKNNSVSIDGLPALESDGLPALES
jgi:Pyridoxamine 5'-phosphate oxidase